MIMACVVYERIKYEQQPGGKVKENMNMIFAIAAGGALGALARHFLNNGVAHLWGTGFPWGIFIANVFGSFLMGVLIAAFAHLGNPSQTLRAFLTIGLLGAFTTFSTYALDSVTLIERGALVPAAFYIVGSVALALGGLAAGMMLVRAILS